MNVVPKLFKWQSEAIKSILEETSELELSIIKSGYGAGKTRLGCVLALSLAIRNAPEPIMVCGVSNVQLKASFYQEMIKFLDEHEVNYRSVWSAGSQEITFDDYQNRPTILFRGLDNPNSFIGSTVSSVILDECAQMSGTFSDGKSVLDTLISRIRPSASALKKLTCISTPDIHFDFFKDLWEGKLFKGKTKHFSAKTVDNELCGFQLAEAFANANADNPRKIKAFLEGEFVNYIEGAIFHQFDDIKHTSKSITKQSNNLIASFDFNFDPAVCLIAESRQNQLFIIDEIYLRNSPITEVVKELINRYPSVNWKICGDRTGWNRTSATGLGPFFAVETTLKELKANYTIPDRSKSNNRVADSCEHTNRQIFNNKIFIADKCKKLIEDLKLCTYKKTSTGNVEIDKSNALRSHMVDALRYLVESEFPMTEKPKPTISVYR